MKNKRIAKFKKFTIQYDSLQKQDRKITSIFLCCGHVHNELMVLAKLFASSKLPQDSDHDIQIAAIIQRNVIGRILSAKLFEACRGLRECERSWKEGAPEKLSHFAPVFQIVEDIYSSDKYKVAKKVRDFSTNHYAPQRIREAISSISGRGDLTLVFGNKWRNCFFPIGEESAYLARFIHDNDPKTIDEAAGQLESYLWWIEESTHKLIGAILNNLYEICSQGVLFQTNRQSKMAYYEVEFGGPIDLQILKVIHGPE